jgi:hypothetical protein
LAVEALIEEPVHLLERFRQRVYRLSQDGYAGCSLGLLVWRLPRGRNVLRQGFQLPLFPAGGKSLPIPNSVKPGTQCFGFTELVDVFPGREEGILNCVLGFELGVPAV